MKVTCGTDIIEIERIRNSIEKIGEKFLNKVYTEKEIEYCESKNKQKYQHYAARFAAKEAAFKAVSWKIKDKYDIKWTDFEVLNDEQGKPIIKIYCIDYSGIENIDLSLSHCKKYAIANVTVLAK